jgi:hypothetical protein
LTWLAAAWVKAESSEHMKEQEEEKEKEGE